MKVLSSTDGARSIYGYRDTQLNMNCYPGLAPDGRTRCLPADVQYAYDTGPFADATCVVRLSQVSGGASCGTPPQPKPYSNVFNVCTSQVSEIHQTGSEYSGTTIYYRTPACTSTSRSAGSRYFYLGPLVSPSTLVELTESLL